MKLTFVALFSIALTFGQDKKPEPTVSDKTRAEYFIAIATIQGIEKQYNDLPAQIKRMFEDAMKAREAAYNAAQTAFNKAAAECGEGFQVDGEALQNASVFRCIAAPKK